MSKLSIALIALLGVALLALIVYIFIKGIKNKWFSQLNATIKAAIKEAEASGKSGSEKKAYVMEKAQAKADELGIPYKPLISLISKFIDEVVANYNVIAKK